MTYSIMQIAKWFISKEDMTHKRLQKLCYYSSAWYYTLKDKELTKSSFQAWQHGPVSPQLHQKFRTQGMVDITLNDFKNISDITDVDDIELLELVWNTYGHLGANSLEILTHSESPWIKARGDLAANAPSKNVISLESMKEYYSSIYDGSYGV
ncbi:DUF4065 domain-containing protein [Erysipelothrix rhusiopathiae]|nr:DUF4065 domain-containing protein [Erysipelothrix rhusiopathiae]